MSVCLESKRNTKKSTASSAKRSFGRKPRSEILEFLFLMLDHCRNNHVPPPTPTVNMIIMEGVEQEIAMKRNGELVPKAFFLAQVVGKIFLQ